MQQCGEACALLMSVEFPMTSGGSALAAMRSLALRGGLSLAPGILRRAAACVPGRYRTRQGGKLQGQFLAARQRGTAQPSLLPAPVPPLSPCAGAPPGRGGEGALRCTPPSAPPSATVQPLPSPAPLFYPFPRPAP